MNVYRTDSGQYIIHKDFSNSAIGTSLYESSADPVNLASVMRNAVIFLPEQLLDNDQEMLELDFETMARPWDRLTDEDLAILYAEAAEEDEELAQLGLAHYADILRLEEDVE